LELFTHITQALINDSLIVTDHYDRLLQQNLSLAKENARLKRSYRELMERKLQLEASNATRKITDPAISDENVSLTADCSAFFQNLKLNCFLLTAEKAAIPFGRERQVG
jgi:hypothetical protein